MIDNPNDPYVKLLVIFGRDDKDLLLAAKGIAQGNILFRGSSVTVDGIKTLQPRQPYDAPNWVRTDRSVTFAELKTYEQQLQSSGLVPDAITVALNLPPDLYLLRANGIDMDLKYRYTMPPVKDSSRMDISLNDQFLQSFSLNSSQDVNKLILRLPVLQGLLDGKSEITIPALRLGAVNQLRFDFQYMNPMPGGSIDNCITFQPVQNHVVIGDDSTIDFSKYYHFIALPDLRVFANAGFPYSRMADLADTLVVVPKAPTQGQVATLLQALGGISFKKGCYTGQEMVARAKFRGANKRALWTLSGTASRVPEAGEDLELKMGDNWRRTGTVLAAVQLDDGSLMVQVVMNNDMEPDSVFRVRDDANTLSIEPLPYSLEE